MVDGVGGGDIGAVDGRLKSVPAQVSLYRRLQPFSLLVVLAGFGLLILANQSLLDRSRAQRHRQATDLVVQELLWRVPRATPDEFHSQLNQLLAPGKLLWLELAPGRPYRRPRLTNIVPLSVSFPQLVAIVKRRRIGDEHLARFTIAGRHYLCSSKFLELSGRQVVLRVVEDISSDIERRRLLLLLLLMVAAAISMFTIASLWVKEARGLRRFLLRGIEKVSGEWHLIAATHNLLKLFRFRRSQQQALAAASG